MKPTQRDSVHRIRGIASRRREVEITRASNLQTAVRQKRASRSQTAENVPLTTHNVVRKANTKMRPGKINPFKVGDTVRLTAEFKKRLPTLAHDFVGEVFALGGRGWEDMLHINWNASEADFKRHTHKKVCGLRMPYNCDYVEKV
jgi:hypothetical protein